MSLSSYLRHRALPSDLAPNLIPSPDSRSNRRPRKVYLSDRERDELARNARTVNMTLSEYVRSRCVYRPAPYVSVDRDALLDCQHELYKQGVNLNQIARQLNTAARRGRLDETISLLAPHLSMTLDAIDRLTVLERRIVSGSYRTNEDDFKTS